MPNISQYSAFFSGDIRELIDQIEAKCGKVIEVRVDEDRGKGLLDPNQAPLYCDVDEIGGQIFIPSDNYFVSEYFNDGSIIHELLHIKRFLADKVPQIASRSKALERGMSEIDNAIEHMIIVPEEIQLRPDRHKRWKDIMVNNLSDLSSGKVAAENIKGMALTSSAFIETVLKDPDLLNQMGRLLKAANIEAESKALNASLTAALGSKETMTNLFFESIGLNKRLARFKYLDVVNENFKFSPIES